MSYRGSRRTRRMVVSCSRIWRTILLSRFSTAGGSTARRRPSSRHACGRRSGSTRHELSQHSLEILEGFQSVRITIFHSCGIGVGRCFRAYTSRIIVVVVVERKYSKEATRKDQHQARRQSCGTRFFAVTGLDHYFGMQELLSVHLKHSPINFEI